MQKFLAKTPVECVWGIGPNTAAYLNKYGVRTALDFALKDEPWVRAKTPKPILELWHELNGRVALELTTEKKTTYQSIAKTKTFTPPSRDERFIFSQLSKNVENACIKARRWGLTTPEIFFFLKTQDFKYQGFEVKLPYPSAVPQDILREVAKFFPHVYQKRMLYRATGITLMKLHDADSAQLDLFGKVKESEGLKLVFESVDNISERYGKHAVFLGSSLETVAFGAHPIQQMIHQNHHRARVAYCPLKRDAERGDLPGRTRQLFKGETAHRRLAIPMLGEVG